MIHRISRLPEQPNYPAPLVFVHGMTMDARCWDTFFLDHFASAGFTCHAVSLRGHEPSRGWRVFHMARIRHYVDDLTAFLAELPSPPVLIGHSMGTAVIQKYLQNGQARAAILLAPVPSHGGWQVALRMIRMHGPGILRDLFTLRRNILDVTADQLRAQCFSAAAPDALIEQVLTQVHMESLPALADLLLLDLPRPARIRGRLPMLVIGGNADALFSPDEMHKAARSLGADVQIFPGMAHNLMQDVGWQGVAAFIVGWLRSLPDRDAFG